MTPEQDQTRAKNNENIWQKLNYAEQVEKERWQCNLNTRSKNISRHKHIRKTPVRKPQIPPPTKTQKTN